MSLKEKRLKIFEKTQQCFYIYEEPLNIESAHLINLKSLQTQESSYYGKVSFFQGTSLQAIEENKKVAVLVFASAKNPGGGVTKGSKAQEEDISLVSSWYFQVKDNRDFYLDKNAEAINSDNILYTKKSYIFLDEHYNILDNPKEISFIGCAAPNLNGLLNQNKSIKKIYEVLKKRIGNVLKTAQQKNLDTLILGAWGTGVFGLDEKKVAQAFNEEISKGYFKGNIQFNIPIQKTLEIFKNEIKINKLPKVKI